MGGKRVKKSYPIDFKKKAVAIDFFGIGTPFSGGG
jgi:hypothetical protein